MDTEEMQNSEREPCFEVCTSFSSMPLGELERRAAPFDGIDLTKVSFADFDVLRTMREAAEDADVEQFAPQIAAARANSTLRQELSVGQIKNTILRLIVRQCVRTMTTVQDLTVQD